MSNVLTYSMGKFLYLTKCFFILIGMQMAVQLTQIWLNRICLFDRRSCRCSVQFPTHTAGVVSYIYWLTNCSFSFLILQNTVRASKEMRLFLDKLVIRAAQFMAAVRSSPHLAWCVCHWHFWERCLVFVACCRFRVTPLLWCQNAKSPRNNEQKKPKWCCGAQCLCDP